MDNTPLRILLVTDAWEPQVNGVVRTLSRTVDECRAMGHEVEVIHPGLGFKTIPLPTYPDIKLALGARHDIEARFRAFEPEAIHISTEGTLGHVARRICLSWKLPFTTSYHTQFPEYVHARFPFIPLAAGYAFMRRFHNSGNGIMVATETMRQNLVKRGFNNLVAWSRGVDTDQFRPDLRGLDGGVYKGLPKPVFAYVGRVAVEKNIEAFLKLDLPGSKVVVGPGPQLEELKRKYKDVHFTGGKTGEELARHFADADVFVFPSFTDTFGLVILEAMACGTPVAAFVAPGPRDIIPGSNAGVVSDDLREACLQALELKREDARAFAEKNSWRACTEQFVDNLKPQPRPERKRFWKRLRRLRRAKS
ncbi:MAG: Glycosyl transferase, group 1 family protein [Oceanicaulis sp. HLUCCA04]|nr:MAG: Glycosyl transferase, group 1 family protein [Oceanicaulis sp. HLUCCA04]